MLPTININKTNEIPLDDESNISTNLWNKNNITKLIFERENTKHKK